MEDEQTEPSVSLGMCEASTSKMDEAWFRVSLYARCERYRRGQDRTLTIQLCDAHDNRRMNKESIK